MSAAHRSPFQGSWYPDQPLALERLLRERGEESSRRTGPLPNGDGLAFVVPHAGPAYSGTVASAVYRAIERQAPRHVIVLAFPHHGRLRGVATPDVSAITTPLGEVAIDSSLDSSFRRVAENSVCDHSFEIQLPFLQKAAPGARVTPLYVGQIDTEERELAAATLAAAWRPGTVLVASSDFTHYGKNFGYTPFPPDRRVAERLRELDFACIDAAGSMDSLLFLETLAENGATVCGSGPISLLLDILRKLGGDAVYQEILDYQTSGEITGDYEHSVSYAALGYYRREAFQFEAADEQALLDSAERTLARLRDTGLREAIPAKGSAALQAHRGAFVSLFRGEELLGCVGNISGRCPLSIEIAELALCAALDDARFRSGACLDGPIDLDISILTPLRRIRGEEQICMGRHGLMLKLGARHGLLLPQVGARHDWTAGDFLTALARKSLLGPRAWRDPRARLYVFEAQVFSRPGLPGKS